MAGKRIPLTEVMADIKDCDMSKGHHEFREKYEKHFGNILNSFTKEENEKIEELLLTSVSTCNEYVMEFIAVKILEKRKIDWKNRAQLVNQLVDAVIKKSIEFDDRTIEYRDFMKKFIAVLNANNLIEQYGDRIFDIVRASHKYNDKLNATIHESSNTVCDELPWEECSDLIPENVKMVLQTVKKHSALSVKHNVCEICITSMHDMFINHKRFANRLNPLWRFADRKKCVADVTEIFKICAECDQKSSDDDRENSLGFEMLPTIMRCYLSSGTTKPEFCKPMMGVIKELAKSTYWQLQQPAESIMTQMADKCDVIGEDETTGLIEKYLKSQDHRIGHKIKTIYQENPHIIEPHLHKFLRLLKEGVEDNTIPELFSEVAKKTPEKVPKGTTEAMAGLLTDQSNLYYVLQYLEAIVKTKPDEVYAYEEKLVKMYQTTEDINEWSSIGTFLVTLANNKERQKRYMDMYAKKMGTMGQNPFQNGILYNMYQIGQQNVEALKKHRGMIEKLKSKPLVKDMCESMIDLMEGRNLENMTNDISAQKEDINQLDTRVTTNEGDIKDVKKDVDTNKTKIGKVTKKVKGQGQKLDNLKQVVDETVERVDELDRKTLSHAPAWSRDVAKLLNVQSDHDWRLLASRLGYKAADIKSWATQPDPCLSMLDEWFATHSTREATNAVKKNLIEINRTDASLYIDQALKSVGEPANPLPIFISYQWAHQKEAKLLRKHLALAGYPAHMDIGQIGEGGGHFSKIDAGIRAAKVVICCVTQKYSESENCTKEVNLSTSLGKPMIPLQMEKMAWPPKGSMGPIFGEYLFVRFFQRDGPEQTKDERFWPPLKFDELLIQLRYHIAPEIDALPKDSPYQNWWRPTQTLPQPKQNASKGLPSVEIPETTARKNKDTSPEVFISYQWDKQTEIKSLYRRLESLGYSCWLDIEQMGGGDSLYDKIDKGLRGSNVMISCVTEKYAKSANCRREVSLADALKKPIIPLKLEQGSAWPPEGPMSMVLAPLKPIDFTKCEPQVFQNWNCPEFEILHKALSHHLGRTALPLKSNQGNPKSQPPQTKLPQPLKSGNPIQSNSANRSRDGSRKSTPDKQGQATRSPQRQGQSTTGQQNQVRQQVAARQPQQPVKNPGIRSQQPAPSKGPYLVSYPRK